MASLLSRALGVTQCNIAHALEKTKYQDADVRWAELDQQYHFSCQVGEGGSRGLGWLVWLVGQLAWVTSSLLVGGCSEPQARAGRGAWLPHAGLITQLPGCRPRSSRRT